jgi:hypothetical protein
MNFSLIALVVMAVVLGMSLSHVRDSYLEIARLNEEIARLKPIEQTSWTQVPVISERRK